MAEQPLSHCRRGISSLTWPECVFLSWVCVCACTYLFISIHPWLSVWYCSILPSVYMRIRTSVCEKGEFDELWACLSLRGNGYRVTSYLDDGLWAWSFNLSTDPHRSLLWWQEGGRRSQNLLIARGSGHSPGCKTIRLMCVSLCFFIYVHAFGKNRHRQRIMMKRQFWENSAALHKHTCVPFISDTWAGHFTADLDYTHQKSVGFPGSVHIKFLWRDTRMKYRKSLIPSIHYENTFSISHWYSILNNSYYNPTDTEILSSILKNLIY